MPEDLVVKTGTTVELNDSPLPSGSGSPITVPVRTLHDLLSWDPLNDPPEDWITQPRFERLLEAAKTVTRRAVSDQRTYAPPAFRQGTSQPDLRRYGAFLAEAGDAARGPGTKFLWNTIRAIDPYQLDGVGVDTSLKSVIPDGKLPTPTVVSWLWRGDITVEARGTLIIGPRVHNLGCSQLRIYRDGTIQVAGSVFIKAASIQGNI